MPPKPKFTEREIVAAGVALVRRGGEAALTARALASELGCSVCPIFTVFRDMEQVRERVLRAVRDLYNSYIEEGLGETLSFRGVGRHYILFAIREPRLFETLFMRAYEGAEIGTILPRADERYRDILAAIRADYGVGVAQAETLYRHLWIYTHGIATMCATKTCAFRPEEIDGMITQVFKSLLRSVREEK